jgi:hypothetical protein
MSRDHVPKELTSPYLETPKPWNSFLRCQKNPKYIHISFDYSRLWQIGKTIWWLIHMTRRVQYIENLGGARDLFSCWGSIIQPIPTFSTHLLLCLPSICQLPAGEAPDTLNDTPYVTHRVSHLGFVTHSIPRSYSVFFGLPFEPRHFSAIVIPLPESQSSLLFAPHDASKRGTLI